MWERPSEVRNVNGAAAAAADRGVGGNAQVVVSFVFPAFALSTGWHFVRFRCKLNREMLLPSDLHTCFHILYLT